MKTSMRLVSGSRKYSDTALPGAWWLACRFCTGGQGALVNQAQIGQIGHLKGDLLDRVEAHAFSGPARHERDLVVRVRVAAQEDELYCPETAAVRFGELQHVLVEARHTFRC